MAALIGIDFGTAFSRVAVFDRQGVRLLAAEDGARHIPSIVGFNDRHEYYVGREAAARIEVEPGRTVTAVKSLLGREPDDPMFERYRDFYRPVFSAAGASEIEFQIDDRTYSPEEMAGMIFAALGRVARNRTGVELDSAVVTVPTYFRDEQRQALQRAAEVGGLDVRRLVSEPTAAALAYAQESDRSGTLAVVNVGDGGFDVSVADVQGDRVDVVGVAGTERLGGWAFDRVLTDGFAQRHRAATGLDVSENRRAMARLRGAAKRARCELSRYEETHVALPNLGVGDRASDFVQRLTRQDFRDLVGDRLAEMQDVCAQAAEGAGRDVGSVDDLLLVGGLGQMPELRSRLESFFGTEAVDAGTPMSWVARGAATQAAMLAGEIDNLSATDVTPMSLGIRTEGDEFVPIVPRNSPIPTREAKTFTTATDHQSVVSIEVFQGGSDRASDNVLLEILRLTDLPRAEAGTAEIEVTFVVDSDGMVDVAARVVDAELEESTSVSYDDGVDRETLRARAAGLEEEASDRASELEEKAFEQGLDVGGGGDADQWLHQPSTGVVDVESRGREEETESSTDPIGGEATDPRRLEPEASQEDGEKLRDSRSRERREMIESLQETNATRIKRKIENLDPPEDDDEAQGYFNRGYKEYRSHAHPNALRYFEQAYEYDSQNALFKTFYAYTLFLTDPTEKETATELLREAVRADDPQVAPDAHFFLGRVLKVKENHSLAKHHFEKAVELDPNLQGAKRELRLYEKREDDDSNGLFDDVFGG